MRAFQRLTTARRRKATIAHDESDLAFLERTYEELLGRPVDEPGRIPYLDALANGVSRERVTAILQASDEYAARERTRRSLGALPDLRAANPDRYAVEHSDEGQPYDVFVADTPADFDWIDGQIGTNGYYEQPGMWSLGADLDKDVMAEMIALLGGRAAIEIGCSSGRVVERLVEHGVDAQGIDVSEFAKSQAPDSVRQRIHIGDVRALELGRRFDVGFGLDIFEHINPNIVDEVIAAFCALLEPPAFLFANIPAFGADPVFGEVFEMFLPSWREDARRERMFRHLQTDERGFPMHGHLVWATTAWWTRHFEAHGLRREAEIEAALHDSYDWYLREASPARVSFYVFSLDVDAPTRDAVLTRCRATPSAVLAPIREAWRAAGLLE
jgi:hypothetical protein